MKNLIVFVFVLLSNSLISQNIKRHNYNSNLLNNDPFIHNICKIESINSSNYILAGKVKSSFIKTTYEKNKRVKYSRKHYYNNDKRVERIVEFGEDINDIKLDKKYFRYGGYYCVLITKEGFSESGKIQFSSEIDKSKNLIIVREVLEDQIKSLDSIYYIDDYKLIRSKKYSADNNLLVSRRIEYEQDRVILNYKVKSNGYIDGAGLVYDQNNRLINRVGIKNAKPDLLHYELSDTTKLFEWTSSGFIYYNTAWEDTLVYNSNLSSISINKDRGIEVKITLSEDFKPIVKETIFSSKSSVPVINQYHYNKYGDLILDIQSKIDEEFYNKRTTYKYEYDKNQNWILMKVFKDNELIFTAERFIEYYE